MTVFPSPSALPSRRLRPALAVASLLSRLRGADWGLPRLNWLAAAMARREVRRLQDDCRRLADLSPHLLTDIGVRQIEYDRFAIEEAVLADPAVPARR